MIDVDDKEIRRLERDLKLFRKQALPYATRQTVNDAAFATRRMWQSEIDDNMTLRNRFTRGSIRVDQTRQIEIRRQDSRVGSIADYMARQEYGGTISSSGSVGHPIATPYSSGEGLTARPRQKLPRRPNQMRNIQLRKGARRQNNVGAVRHAAEQGHKFVFLDLGRRKGIFRVTGGRRSPKIRMVQDLTRRVVRTPINPTLGPALRKVEPQLTAIYHKNLVFQLKRHRILSY